MKRRLSQIETNDRVKREKDPIPWRYCLLSLGLGLLLVGGFFVAARQHFTAMTLGINNSKLRQQREALQNELRQYQLAKEIALAPAELEKAAQAIGLQKITASHIDFIATEKTDVKKAEAKPKLEKDSLWGKPNEKVSSNNKPKTEAKVSDSEISKTGEIDKREPEGKAKQEVKSKKVETVSKKDTN